jgi:hypothetical protein
MMMLSLERCTAPATQRLGEKSIYRIAHQHPGAENHLISQNQLVTIPSATCNTQEEYT